MADPSQVERSARNRFVGLVTDIVMDKVMAQVELQCGPFRVVSLMSSEAVRELGLELGSVAVAVVKSTTVIIETPQESREAPARCRSPPRPPCCWPWPRAADPAEPAGGAGQHLANRR